MRNALILLALTTFIISCAPVSTLVYAPTNEAISLPSETFALTTPPINTPSLVATSIEAFEPTTTTFLPSVANSGDNTFRLPPLEASWQIQYNGEIDTSLDVDVFNLDLFDTHPSTIQALHKRDVFVMCYFSAGSYEEWRVDSDQFPAEVLGKDLEGWPGEKWIDIRRVDTLAPVMEARLNLAVAKDCDGVDPDNVNGYTNDTGFPLTYEDQIRYNVFLAEAAHLRGLSIGLKNDIEQVPDLIPYFDWLLNEECFFYQECGLLLPFVEAGKPAFVIEYELEPSEFCPQAISMNLNALRKNWELDAYRVDCRKWSDSP